MTLRDLHRWSPPLAIAGWFHIVLLPVALLAFPFDTRLVLGINPWIKPIKFDVSTILFVWTMAWYLGRLPQRWNVRAIGWLIAVSMFVENVIVTAQSARGTTSHFNNGSALDGVLFGIMGLFIVVNTVAVFWTFVLFLKESTALPPVLLLGAQLGLLLFLFGTIEGGLMIARQSHTVGGPDGGPGLPFLTWSTKFGDLRWAHFLGMHGLQALPVTAWLLGQKALVAAVFTVALGITILAMLIALDGRPMLAL